MYWMICTIEKKIYNARNEKKNIFQEPYQQKYSFISGLTSCLYALLLHREKCLQGPNCLLMGKCVCVSKTLSCPLNHGAIKIIIVIFS